MRNAAALSGDKSNYFLSGAMEYTIMEFITVMVCYHHEVVGRGTHGLLCMATLPFLNQASANIWQCPSSPCSNRILSSWTCCYFVPRNYHRGLFVWGELNQGVVVYPKCKMGQGLPK